MSPFNNLADGAVEGRNKSLAIRGEFSIGANCDDEGAT
jgi:hypothetical protein